MDVTYHYVDTLFLKLGQILDILIIEAANRTRGDSDFTAFQSKEGLVFEPKTVIGINAGSTKQEIAKDIIKFALSEEVQKVDVEDGLPVHEAALQYCIEGRSLPQGSAWGVVSEREGKECWVYLSWKQGDIKVFK